MNMSSLQKKLVECLERSAYDFDGGEEGEAHREIPKVIEWLKEHDLYPSDRYFPLSAESIADLLIIMLVNMLDCGFQVHGNTILVRNGLLPSYDKVELIDAFMICDIILYDNCVFISTSDCIIGYCRKIGRED